MGISNRIATKIRTAAKTETVPLPRPYLDTGAVVAAAIVRAAASTIGQLKLGSSTFRGQDVLGIREARSTYLSTVKVSQRGLVGWSVSLGVLTVSGWTADWMVNVVVEDSPVGATVNVTTPATLTRDGTLVNKSAHGELRDLVLSGLRAGKLPAGTAELAVSKAGLAAEELEPFYALIPAQTLRTKLPVAEVHATLALVPFPVADRQPDRLRWQLGTAGALADRFAHARITDQGDVRTIELECPPQPTGSAVLDGLVARRAGALFQSVQRTIYRLDRDIEITSEPIIRQRPTAGV